MDWKTKFHTKEDFDRVLLEEQSKTTWGRWTLDKADPPSLDIRPYPNSAAYQIVLFKVGCGWPKFLGWLGNWTQHLQLKGWMSYKDLWDFVEAAQNIYRREVL